MMNLSSILAGIVSAISIVAGLLLWRKQAVDDALEKQRSKTLASRSKASRKAKRTANRVRAAPDDELKKRTGKWVRK